MNDEQPQEGTDPGEAFVPGATPEGVDQVVQPVKLADETIAKALRSATGKANELAGEKAKCNLEMTAFEAGLIAPGVRRYLEARPALAATMLAGGNEYLRAGVGLTWYGGRVTLERHRAIAAELEAEAETTPPPASSTGPIPSEFLRADPDAAVLRTFYGDPADPSDPRD